MTGDYEEAFCAEVGCNRPATDERPAGMSGDIPVVELVCANHTDKAAA